MLKFRYWGKVVVLRQTQYHLHFLFSSCTEIIKRRKNLHLSRVDISWCNCLATTQHCSPEQRLHSFFSLFGFTIVYKSVAYDIFICPTPLLGLPLMMKESSFESHRISASGKDKPYKLIAKERKLWAISYLIQFNVQILSINDSIQDLI